MGLPAVMIGSEQALLHSQHQEQPLKSGEALDVAARYLLYKLYDTQRGNGVLWQTVRALGEAAANVSRAVDLGWAAVRDEGTGKARRDAPR
jgi:hypothetical protein